MASTELRAAAQQALEQVQEFKRRWWLVPAFGNKVNKATREAITNAHSPIFELEHALRAALEEPQSTHSAACYQWHHKCAIAEVERLRAALAEPVQEQAKSDHETRAEIAEQQIVQLAEERDHYRHLWQKAQQAEPVPEPDSPERRCGGPGCDMKCCQPVQEPGHGVGGEG